jgi:heme iron utilization protein
MNSEDLAAIAALIRGQRVAALGTLHEERPFTSMVAYAVEPDFGVLLHLSRLAAHTKYLLTHPQAALLIHEPDDGRDDPQTLARITLAGAATPIPAENSAYVGAQACYLARLPAATPLFEFPDFALFRFVPSEARYVGGFGRIYTLTTQHLQQAARLQLL